MPLNLSVPPVTELKPRITVIGVGGAGGNAVNNMIQSELDGVKFVVANTDAQAVGLSLAEHKIQLGADVTKGLGAGAQPEIGNAAAVESLDQVLEHLEGSNMCFITAGMGGGTGTGAAPVIAEAARARNILTVGVVTKPFHFEGARRMRIAEEGIKDLQQYVDTLLIIPNQNLFRLADDNTTFADAFAMADQVLHSGVRGITDLMIVPGLINLDFADVRSVMNEMGKAMMGTGEAEGENRAAEAAAAAISNPLLDEVSMKGAKGVLINITGGMDMKLFEVDEAANRIRGEVDPDANIIVGSTFAHDMEGKMRVSVVATGIDCEEALEGGRAAVIHRGATPAQTRQPAQQPSAGSLFDEPILNQPSRPAAPKVAAKAPPAIHRPQAATPPQMPQMRNSVPNTAPEQNPVGDVQARIRKMLTEGEQAQAPVQPPKKSNPFRLPGAAQGGLSAAVDLLKETFGGAESPEKSNPVYRKQAAPKARPPESDLFDGEDDPDLDIPAFLRRGGKR